MKRTNQAANCAVALWLLIGEFNRCGLSADPSSAPGRTPTAAKSIGRAEAKDQAEVPRSWTIQTHSSKMGMVQSMAATYTNSHPDIVFRVAEGSTVEGVRGLLSGSTAAFVTEGRLSHSGNAFHVAASGDRPEEFWIGCECLAIYVQADNPVEQLTVDQLRRIYLGMLKNWNQLGGPDLPIVAYGLPDESSHGRLMLDIVLGGRADIRRLQPVPGDAGLRRALGRDKASIGFGSLAARGEGVKLVKIGTGSSASLPEPTAVRDGHYPLARRVCLYLGRHSQRPVRDFVTWLIGDEAQQRMEELGHVSITPHLRIR